MPLGLSSTEAGIKLNGAQVNNLWFSDDIFLLNTRGPEQQGKDDSEVGNDKSEEISWK